MSPVQVSDLDVLFERMRDARRPAPFDAQVMAERAIVACMEYGLPEVRNSIDNRALVLTWRISPLRSLVWYAEEGDELRPARVVQRNDPSLSVWADVGAIDDLVDILREELGE